MATPISSDKLNHVTYNLDIKPLANEEVEPEEEGYVPMEHTFNISNMKVYIYSYLPQQSQSLGESHPVPAQLYI